MQFLIHSLFLVDKSKKVLYEKKMKEGHGFFYKVKLS